MSDVDAALNVCRSTCPAGRQSDAHKTPGERRAAPRPAYAGALLALLFAWPLLGAAPMRARAADTKKGVFVKQGTNVDGAVVAKIGDKITLQVYDNMGGQLAVTWKAPANTAVVNFADPMKPTEGNFVIKGAGGYKLEADTAAGEHFSIFVWSFPPLDWKFKSAPFNVSSDPEGNATLDLDVGGPTVDLTATPVSKNADNAETEVSFVDPADADHKYQARWSLPDPAIVRLTDEKGKDLLLSTDMQNYLVSSKQIVKVRPLGVGTTNIKIAVGAQVKTLTLNVVSPTLVPSASKLTVPVKGKIELNATVQDGSGRTLADRDANITWKIISTTTGIDIAELKTETDDKQVKKTYLLGKKQGSLILGATYATTKSTSLINVDVVPQLETADLDTPEPMVVGQSLKLQLRLKDANNQAFRDDKFRALRLDFDAAIITARVLPDDPTGRTLLITAVAPGSTNLVVHYSPDNNPDEKSEKTLTITILVSAVSHFDKVTVNLNVMDERTAADAFGKRASQEFYVVQVTMVNNLKRNRVRTSTVSETATVVPDTAETPDALDGGNSILVFSDTFETHVRLEKRFDPGSKTRRKTSDPADNQWTTVTASDRKDGGVDTDRGNYYVDIPLRRVITSVEEPGPDDKTKKPLHFKNLKFRVPISQLTLHLPEPNMSPRSYRLMGIVVDQDQHIVKGKGEPLLEPLDTRVEKVNDAFLPRLEGKSTIRITFDTVNGEGMPVQYAGTLYVTVLPPAASLPSLFVFRPYTYQLIDATFDARSRRGDHAIFFSVLQGLGSFGSFLTSFIKFDRAGHDVAFLNSYNGLLLPALDKLLPDQTETQRLNTSNLLMRHSEEIPFGQSISRVLFYPKRGFHGYLEGYETRIGAIDTNFFNVDVAVISSREKAGTPAAPQGNPQPISTAPPTPNPM